MTTKRMGRPPKSGDGNLDALIQCRVTADDRAALEQAASFAGQKLSDWIRERLMAAARREMKRANRSA